MEASAQLRQNLMARGYRTAQGFEDLGPTAKFGAISLLNVLDRCDDPRALLSTALRSLQPRGMLIIATVLPFCDRVYVGERGRLNAHRLPTTPIALPDGLRCERRRPFEHQAAAFVASMLQDLPLEVAAWARVPYLCTGTASRTYYHLDDAVFVLRRTADGHASGDGRALGGVANSAHVDELCGDDKQKFTWLAEVMRRSRPAGWGDVLDAGLGRSSLCWLVRQPCRTITGITAVKEGPYGHTPLQRVAAASSTPVDLMLGNWHNASLVGALHRYDVVLLDYLLAAVHMHWPFAEEEVLRRTLRTVGRQGFALITGIEPYEEVLSAAADPRDATVLNAEALGDAAALLAQRRSYRELPKAWVLREVEAIGGFRMLAEKTFPMTLTASSLRSQLSFAEQEAAHVADAQLRGALLTRASRLKGEVMSLGTHRRSRSYAIVLQRTA